MDTGRGRARAAGLARTASWTRRAAVGAAVLTAALGVSFAHDIPGSSATPAQTSTTGHGTGGQLQTPAQPPAGGGGPAQVTTGSS